MSMARLTRQWLFQLWAAAIQPPFPCNLYTVVRVKSKYPSQPRAARGFSAWRLSLGRRRAPRESTEQAKRRGRFRPPRPDLGPCVLRCCAVVRAAIDGPGTDFWALAPGGGLGTDVAELRLPSCSEEGSVSPRSRDSLTCPPISACHACGWP
jgi:hypothetical protein